MAANDRVGIFLSPSEEIDVDKEQWLTVKDYIQDSCNINIVQSTVCSDDKTHVFLISQYQLSLALEINQVIVGNKRYDVDVWQVPDLNLAKYFKSSQSLDGTLAYLSDEESDDLNEDGEANSDSNEDEDIKEESDGQKTISVTGIGLSSLPPRRIKAYFENHLNGGGEIDKIIKTGENSEEGLLISFVSTQVAEHLVQKKTVTISGVLLDITWPLTVRNYESNQTIIVSVMDEDENPLEMDEDEFKDIMSIIAKGEVKKISSLNASERLVTLQSHDEFRALVKEGKYVYEDVLLKFAAYEINSDHVKTENDVTKKLIQEIQEVQGKKAIQENKLNQINTCEEAAAFNAEQKKLNYNNTRSRSNITNEENCEKRTSILVTGLTTAMNKEYLELFFESEQECGGGDLDYTWPVDIDEVNKRAIVTFQDDSVAKRVVSQKKIEIEDMNATLIVSWAPERNVVEIGGASNAYDLDDIKNILEQEKFGALNVSEVTRDESTGKIFAIFASEAEARSLSQLQAIKWEDVELSVSLCSFGLLQSDNIDFELEADEKADEENIESTQKIGNVVFLTGIPTGFSTQKLRLYFTNESKSGGGKFQKTMEIEGNKAFLYYFDTTTAQRVVNKGTHVLDGVNLVTHWPGLFTVVEILGTTSEMHAANLKALLQSGRCNRAKVKEMVFTDGKVYAEMETEEEANKLIDKGKIQFKSAELIFILAKFYQQSNTKLVQLSEGRSAVPTKSHRLSKTIEPEDIIHSLEISGFPHDAHEWDVRMFLGSKNYSGGGDIYRFHYDEQNRCAHVTFVKTADAKGVLQRQPLVFKEKYHLTTKPLMSVMDDNGKPATSHTIKIIGLKNANDEAIKAVFESRIISGGERDTVVEVNIASDCKSATVIYKNAETAERVAQKKTIKYDGYLVSVIYMKPLPLTRIEGDTEPNKLAVYSFSDNCSPAKLQRFLERKSQSKIQKIEYSLVPSVALVTFNEVPDYRALQLLCVQSACYDSMIGVRKVLKPDSIQVHGIRNIDEYSLRLHFELPQNGASKVKNVIPVKDDDNACLIQFETSQVVQLISNIPIQSYGQGQKSRKLHVRAYYIDLDIVPPNHNTNEPVKSIPRSVQIDISNLDIANFIAKTGQMRSSLDEKLAQVKAKPDWAYYIGNASKFQVLCELQYNSPNIQQLVSSWATDVETIVNEFFNRFVSKTIDVFEVLWEEFVNYSSAIIEECAEKVDLIIIELDKDMHRVKLMGLKDEVNSKYEQLQIALSDIQDKNEIASKTISEDISNLKPYQFELFLMLKLSDVLQKTLNVSVIIDEKNMKLLLKGVPENIREAKLKILESLQTTSRSLDILPEFSLLLQRDQASAKELRDSLLDKDLSNIPLEVVWELREDCIILYAKDELSAKKGISILSDNLKERKLKLDEPCKKFAIRDGWKILTTSNKKVVLSDTISAVVKYSKDDFNSLVVSGLGSTVLIQFDENIDIISFYGIKTPAERAKELVSEYLTERAIYENFIRFNWNMCKYINLRYCKEIQNLQAKHEFDNVRIHVSVDQNNSGVAVRGKKIILDAIVKELHDYENKASKVKYSDLDQARYEFYQTVEGRNFLQSLEKEYKVAILSNVTEIRDYKKSITHHTNKICEVNLVNSETGLQRRLDIVVLIENIVSLPVDAIVNPANENLDLLGGVAGAILKTGGPEVQKECEAFVKQNGPLQVSQVFVSSAGNLLCKQIIHAVGPQWQNGSQNEANDLYDTVYNALTEASNRNLRQIAMTPIGAGLYGFPINVSLHNIVDAIKVYFDDEKNTNLQKIFMTSTRTEEVREMIKQLKQSFGSSVNVIQTELDEKLASEETFIQTNDVKSKQSHQKVVNEIHVNETGVQDDENRNILLIIAENNEVAKQVISDLQTAPIPSSR